MKKNNRFDLAVVKEIQFDNKTLLLFDGSKSLSNISFDVKVEPFRNVVCLDHDGNILWWIQGLIEFLLGTNSELNEKDLCKVMPVRTYTNVLTENGQLKVFNFSGAFCVVDINTGRILEIEWEK